MKHEWWSKNRAWFLDSSSGGCLEDNWSLYSYQNLLKTKVNKLPKRMMKIREECANTIFRNTWYLLYRTGGFRDDATPRCDLTTHQAEALTWTEVPHFLGQDCREQKRLVGNAMESGSRAARENRRSAKVRAGLAPASLTQVTALLSTDFPPLTSTRFRDPSCFPSWNVAFRDCPSESLLATLSDPLPKNKSVLSLVLETRFCEECRDRPVVMAFVSTVLKMLCTGLLCSFHCHCWEIRC